MHNDGLLKEAETMTEKSAFDKALGELNDLIDRMGGHGSSHPGTPRAAAGNGAALP